MDNLTPEKRSWNMKQIKSENTLSEIALRKALHHLGYRYLVHVKKLPGKPDLVLPKYKTVIFVNGCFWHQHQGCKRCTMPKTNTNYWMEKFEKNIMRDQLVNKKLNELGYRVFIVWECELKNINEVTDRFAKFVIKTEGIEE